MALCVNATTNMSHPANAATIQALSNLSRYIETEIRAIEARCDLSHDSARHLRKSVLATQDLTRLLDVARAFEVVSDRHQEAPIALLPEGKGDTERLPLRKVIIKGNQFR